MTENLIHLMAFQEDPITPGGEAPAPVKRTTGFGNIFKNVGDGTVPFRSFDADALISDCWLAALSRPASHDGKQEPPASPLVFFEDTHRALTVDPGCTGLQEETRVIGEVPALIQPFPPPPPFYPGPLGIGLQKGSPALGPPPHTHFPLPKTTAGPQVLAYFRVPRGWAVLSEIPLSRVARACRPSQGIVACYCFQPGLHFVRWTTASRGCPAPRVCPSAALASLLGSCLLQLILLSTI